MAKPLTTTSDPGREDRERVAVDDDPAISWEREEQDRLPPRGEGSQKNQGEEKQATVAEVGNPAEDTGPLSHDGLQLGGTRGPSKQA